jgi:hypothetical protein
MAPNRSQIRQLPHTAPHLRDIAPRLLLPLGKINTKPDSPLHHKDLARLEEELPEFGPDIQIPLLSAQEKVTVVVAVGLVVRGHGGVERVDVQRDALADIRVPAAGERVETGYEVCRLRGGRDGERRPFCLLRQ